MSRVREYVRVMWWRHGPGAHRRLVATVFAHGLHGGYHAGRGEQSPCDERCTKILAAQV